MENIFDKVLHVGLNTNDIKKYLYRLSNEYVFIDISKHRYNINEVLYKKNKELNPELNFFQIQHENILNNHVIQELKGVSVNWTGDVRKEIPKLFLDNGRYFNYNLLCCDDNVKKLRELGINSFWMPSGFDAEVFNNIYDINYSFGYNYADIVFLGNNYINAFPLSKLRNEMVMMLREKYKENFNVYGFGWNFGCNLNGQNIKERNVYVKSKIAINLSHFDCSKYSSDRIYRIIGSGGFCLAKRYNGIEEEFTDKKHLVIWDNLDDLIKKIDYYLLHDEERKQIAINGYNHVHKKCTWEHRFRFVKNLITQKTPNVDTSEV